MNGTERRGEGALRRTQEIGKVRADMQRRKKAWLWRKRRGGELWGVETEKRKRPIGLMWGLCMESQCIEGSGGEEQEREREREGLGEGQM